MTTASRHLVILGCSKVKSPSPASLPAIERYDGSAYQVLRAFLRQSEWPEPLSIAILSAKYGLIGGLTPIDYYDQRMDRSRAAELNNISTQTLIKWGKSHQQVSLVLGKDYLPALDLDLLQRNNIQPVIADGPIGMKLHQLRSVLHEMDSKPRLQNLNLPTNRSAYFLPDWDDMVDVGFNFQTDEFSHPEKSQRDEVHCIAAMRPQQICDGVLVSLAQHFSSKGVLKRFSPTDKESLAPEPLKRTFGLNENQWVFGDCGAFTYVNEARPTITIEQALSLYQIYGFDFGASVDHIPVTEIEVNDKKVQLTQSQRQGRVKLTRENAATFYEMHRKRKCSFIPVGVIQGLSPQEYATQLAEYAEIGYTHVALGGLVPQGDTAIVETVQAVSNARQRLRSDMWIHLFGVFRPKIQVQLREAGINSFDSATYFRKSWLRSDQNYLGADGNWYAALRVPMTSDARTRIRLQAEGESITNLEILEHASLTALHEYGARQRDLESTLQIVTLYDSKLTRGDERHSANLLTAYRRTLEARPWETCYCPACASIGIDILIFRGYNRNKRRGAHNTLMLYRNLTH